MTCLCANLRAHLCPEHLARGVLFRHIAAKPSVTEREAVLEWMQTGYRIRGELAAMPMAEMEGGN